MIFAGSNARHFGIGKEVFVKRFSDNEIYVRLPEKPQGKAYYLQSFFPNQNDSLVEAFLTIDALYDNGAREVVLIAPYFPYTKQDKIFLEGEALSVRALIKLFSGIGIAEIHMINAHFLKKEGVYHEWGVEIFNYNAALLLKEKINAELFILPGRGAGELLKGENVVCVETRRSEEYEEKEQEIYRRPNVFLEDLHVEGKNVAVVDDMLATGSTMAETCKKLKEMGAKIVKACAVHGLFVGNAIEKLKVAGEIIVTDTVKSLFSKVSVLPIIKDIVKEKLNEK